MANLAILGHSTRGAEIIQLLEMLGGVNYKGLYGVTTGLYYFIDNSEIWSCESVPDNYIPYTLEEFEKKFPYKVGDKVTYQPFSPAINIKVDGEIIEMSFDNNINEIVYTTSNGHIMLASNLQPCKEEPMEERKISIKSKTYDDVVESPSKTFPRVNEFETGTSYRR